MPNRLILAGCEHGNSSGYCGTSDLDDLPKRLRNGWETFRIITRAMESPGSRLSAVTVCLNLIMLGAGADPLDSLLPTNP